MLTVVCGPMFAGKSSHLLSVVEDERQRGQVLVLKSVVDVRHARDQIVTHDGDVLPCSAIATLDDLRPRGYSAIVVDEWQFFGPSDVRVAHAWSRAGTAVWIYGLDMDYLGEPFEATALAMGVAGRVIKRRARCAVCGEPAQYSRRKVEEAERVKLGGAEAYEPRCAAHFLKGGV